MEGQGRSENLVLQSTIDYMKLQIEEYQRLKAEAEAAGMDVASLEIVGLEHSPLNTM